MNKKFLVIIFILIMSIIFIYAFSTSYSSHNIDNIAYVIALGIDLSEDKQNLKITFEFTDISSFSKDGSSESTSPILEEVTVPSINSGINIMNSYLGKQINLAHCKVVVLSEDIAKRGLLSEIAELINDKQVRATTNVVIAQSSSNKYLETSTSSLEKTITKYYDIFTNSTTYTGYTSNLLIGDFYESLLTYESGAVAIYGNLLPSSNSSKDSKKSDGSSTEESSKKESSNEQSSNQNTNSSDDTSTSESNTSSLSSNESSIKGEKGTENVGLAVFKDKKFIQPLSSEETLCYCLISNKVDNFFISINSPWNNEQSINLSSSINTNPHIKIDISDDIPTININLDLNSNTLNIIDGINYTDKNVLKSISDSEVNYLTYIINNYLNKCSSELNVDLNNFYKVAKSKFLTNNDWENFDWKTKFQNAKFNVNIKNNLISNSIISENKK